MQKMKCNDVKGHPQDIEDSQRKTRERDSELTALICTSSHSAQLFIELSTQQLLTRICQVSGLFNFRPNALQHGSLSVRTVDITIPLSTWVFSCLDLYNSDKCTKPSYTSLLEQVT